MAVLTKTKQRKPGEAPLSVRQPAGYWAVTWRKRWARTWTRGRVQDFYPCEHDIVLAELRRDKYQKVLGEFATYEEAEEVLQCFLDSDPKVYETNQPAT
jgi:hypothetical protein